MQLHNGLHGHASPCPCRQLVASISIEGRSEKYPSNTHSDKKHSSKRTGWRRGVSTYQKNTVLLQKKSIWHYSMCVLCVCVWVLCVCVCVRAQMYPCICNLLSNLGLDGLLMGCLGLVVRCVMYNVYEIPDKDRNTTKCVCVFLCVFCWKPFSCGLCDTRSEA